MYVWLTYASDSYSVDVADEVAFCSLSLMLPLHIRVATSDGRLLVETVSTWALAQITEPDTHVDELGIATGLFADPQDSGWFSMSVAQMWPDIASPADDAELTLLIIHRNQSITGLLTYEKREIIDATTVIYDLEVLLEWSAALDATSGSG